MSESEVQNEEFKILNDVEEQSLQDNAAYWDTKELTMVGKLAETYDFLPGRSMTIHTLDSAELLLVGKILDREFGQVSNGFAGSSYINGLHIVTLSLALDNIDGESVWSVASESDSDAYSDKVSIFKREQSLNRKSEAVRRLLHSFIPEVVKMMYDQYIKLHVRKEEAVKLLPFYSDRGEKLPD